MSLLLYGSLATDQVRFIAAGADLEARGLEEVAARIRAGFTSLGDESEAAADSGGNVAGN